MGIADLPPIWFDKTGRPITMDEFSALHDMNYRRIAETTIGDWWISTVWLGINHRFFDDGPPLIFETMPFYKGRIEHDIDVVPAQKMDTPHGLFRGTCSCGWLSGLDSRKRVLLATGQHARALLANDLEALHPELRDLDQLAWRWATEEEAIAGHDAICIDLRVLLENVRMAEEVHDEAIARKDAP